MRPATLLVHALVHALVLATPAVAERVAPVDIDATRAALAQVESTRPIYERELAALLDRYAWLRVLQTEQGKRGRNDRAPQLKDASKAIETDFRRALAIRARLFGPDSIAARESRSRLGYHLANTRQFAAAEPLLTRAIQDAPVPQHATAALPEAMKALALVREHQDRRADALNLRLGALGLAQRLAVPRDWRYAKLLTQLAYDYQERNQLDESARYLALALSATEQDPEADDLALMRALLGAAAGTFNLRQFDQTDALLLRASALGQHLPPDAPELATLRGLQFGLAHKKRMANGK